MICLHERGRRSVWPISLILLATIVVYLPTLNSYFMADDFSMFTKPIDGSGQRGWLRTHPGHIRPIPRLSMLLDYKLWGLNPTPAHTFNLLLHLACTALVGMLALRISGRRPVAMAASLLFGLHPIHVGAVSWLSARFDLFCTFFVLTSLLKYDDYRESGRTRPLVASLLLFACALFSKELAVCLPLLVLCQDLCRRRKVRVKHLLPHLVLLGLYLGLRFMVIGGIGGRMSADGTSGQLNTTPIGFLKGLFLHPTEALVLPVNELQWGSFSSALELALGALLLAAAAAAVVTKTFRWSRVTWFGLGLLVLSALPFATMIEDGFQAGLSNSRLLYLPSAGFCLLLAELCGGIGRSRIMAAILGLLAITYGITTFGNNLAWRRGAEISDELPRTIAASYPTFGVEKPILIIEDAPRFHNGAYVFLGRSMERSLELSLPEGHKAIVIAEQSKNTVQDLRSLQDSSRIFAFRWDEERQRMVDVTSASRKLFDSIQRTPVEPMRWAGRGLSAWTVSGTGKSRWDEQVNAMSPGAGTISLSSPRLPSGTGLIELTVSAEATGGGRASPTVTVFWRTDREPWGGKNRARVTLRRSEGAQSYEFATRLGRLEQLDTKNIHVRFRLTSPGHTLRIHSIGVHPLKSASRKRRR